MIDELIDARRGTLPYYSPFSFLQNRLPELGLAWSRELRESIRSQNAENISVRVGGHDFAFVTRPLQWDTAFFAMRTYRLDAVLYQPTSPYKWLVEALRIFRSELARRGCEYCFSIVPSEDIVVIQAMNQVGFRLVESRLTYYLDLSRFSAERYAVRRATDSDINSLRKVASEMRNPYDRFHADIAISEQRADEFMGVFAEQSVKGFADYVMVPAEPGIPPDAFVTASYLKDRWPTIGQNISKMVFSAVSRSTCKGWYRKLISEMAYHLRDVGAQIAFMHPATTNGAVIHCYETLGCKYGKCQHVLSLKEDPSSGNETKLHG